MENNIMQKKKHMYIIHVLCKRKNNIVCTFQRIGLLFYTQCAKLNYIWRTIGDRYGHIKCYGMIAFTATK